MSTNIEIIIRAFITYQGKVLFNHSPGNPPKFYYLPGGHLEKGESIEECLRREFKEEMGASVKSMKFLEVFENFYKDKIGDHHEINLLYQVQLSDADLFSLKSQESHIKIAWLPVESLKGINLLPEIIAKYCRVNYDKINRSLK